MYRKRSNRKSRVISRKSKRSGRKSRIVSIIARGVKSRRSKGGRSKARIVKSRRSKSRKNRKSKFGMTVNGIVTIYGRDTCPACVHIKDFCKEKSIAYKFIIRDSTDEKQNSIINSSEGIEKDYMYIPVIISSDNKFLGGSEEFKQLMNKKN